LRLPLIVCLIVAITLPASAGAVRTAGLRAGAVPALSERGCELRVNDTVAKLEQCIREPWLWKHLAVFQQIADANPAPNGHGNRNTGTPGYAASVAYVAKLMRAAGYDVKIQSYNWEREEAARAPRFLAGGHAYVLERDWYVARGSGAGTLSRRVEPATGAGTGCTFADFAAFAPGTIALLERGPCVYDQQIENARAAGAAGAVIYNAPDEGAPREARLVDPPGMPVVALVSYAVGAALLRAYAAGSAPTATIDIWAHKKSAIDYNVIADSPYGDPNQTVVIDGHLDAIYGAGMLDNASGSTTMLEIALALAKTPTRNRLRYIWFGGEEIGLLGSKYYTQHLGATELRQTAFDVDVDVTATPNFDVLVAGPAQAHNAARFPKNVIPQSRVGNELFGAFFKSAGVISQLARFGNDGTDSNAFSLVGVPNSGILTQQDCCKKAWETALWGGFLGNYEGKIPSSNGGCVDNPHRWCDNLSNNDPFVFELASKATAYVTFELANLSRFPQRAP
jgi:peptidase M28-like protein/PA domain-containing protein